MVKISALIYLLFLLILCLSSCQKEIEITLPFEGKKLVVYSLLNDEEIISAQISQTFPPTGNEPADWLVRNAQVFVFENGNFFDSLVFDSASGRYFSSLRLQPGVGYVYSLSVRAEGFSSVISEEVKLPAQIKIDHSSFVDSSYETGSTNSSGGIVEIEFQDPPGSAEYYLPGASSIFENRNEELGTCLGGDLRGTCLDLESTSCIFSDDCIVNNPTRIRIGVKSTIQTQSTPQKADFIIIKIESLSLSLYQYYLTSEQPIGLETAFIAPNSPYSNILGGYGLLGAVTASVDTIFLD